MLNILKTILDIITNLLNFGLSFISSFLMLLVNIPSYINFITSNLLILPNLLIPFITASLSLYVIFLILGRNN